MDTTVSPPAPPAAPAPIARAEHHALHDAVHTELATEKSVQQVVASEAVQSHISHYAANASRIAEVIRNTEQRFERDRDTDTLVFKQIDPGTGKVILQLPTQSLLNLRAYLKQQETAANTGLKKTA